MIHLLHLPEFQMSFLLFLALAGYILASRIHQSAVIGEILVGIIVGPSLLNLFTYTDFVQSTAHLGAVIMLFVVGLEFNIKEIAKFKYFMIALIGVIVPWIFGFILARLFGYNDPASIFIGTALTATSIAITANVLKEMGKLQTEAGKAIIGAAVIDDILGLLVLAFSKGLAHGNLSGLNILIIFLKAIGFLIIGALVGHYIIKKIVNQLSRTEYAQTYPEMTFIFTMMFAFLYGMIAELIGLSAIVGAFLAGATLGGTSPATGKSYKEGAEYLQIIFSAVFFISLGILANFKALAQTGSTIAVIIFLGVLTIAAIISKIFGCGITAKLNGLNTQDSLVVGVGMVPRGEVAMIVALIGLNDKVIGQDAYVSLILMSLLTTIITPILLQNWLFKVKN